MAVNHYTKLQPYEDYTEYNYNYSYNYYNCYEEYEYNYNPDSYYNYSNDNYKRTLQDLHSTLTTTLTFLTHLLNSFSDDIQNLTYVSEHTINQLWTAKVSSFSSTAIHDRTGGGGSGGGGCPLIRKIRAFLRPEHNNHNHNHNHRPRTNIEDRKKTAADYLSALETDLIKAVSISWPPKGTVYGPDSVVYSDLSLDNLYDRLVIALDYFPVVLRVYKHIKAVFVQLQLLQIAMDRTMFLWS